jgi:hypothetical protein
MGRRSRGRDLGVLPHAQSCPFDRRSTSGRRVKTGDRRGPSPLHAYDQLPRGEARASLPGMVRVIRARPCDRLRPGRFRHLAPFWERKLSQREYYRITEPRASLRKKLPIKRVVNIFVEFTNAPLFLSFSILDNLLKMAVGFVDDHSVDIRRLDW